MTKKGIVWFKTDLRLHDNETLIRAIEENDAIIPVYCFNPQDLNKLNDKMFEFVFSSRSLSSSVIRRPNWTNRTF